MPPLATATTTHRLTSERPQCLNQPIPMHAACLPPTLRARRGGQLFPSGLSTLLRTRAAPVDAAAAQRARGRRRRSHRSDSGSLHVHTLALQNFFALIGSSVNARTHGVETQSVTPDQTAPLFRPPRTELPRRAPHAQAGRAKWRRFVAASHTGRGFRRRARVARCPSRKISPARSLRPVPRARRRPAPENACRRRDRPSDWRGASALPSPPRSAA